MRWLAESADPVQGAAAAGVSTWSWIGMAPGQDGRTGAGAESCLAAFKCFATAA